MKNIDDCIVYTPCGSPAVFDEGSGIGYRCLECYAIIGSIGMPTECRELYDQEKVINKLKGSVANNL